MSIHWITPTLGTSPASEVIYDDGIEILDIRDLVDKKGNRVDIVKNKIDTGSEMLKRGAKVIVCCDYGISRSNAVAAGIISLSEGISLENAVKQVITAIGDVEIKAELLRVVRDALTGKDIHNKNVENTILITGGSGFLGSGLIKKIEESHKFIAPSHVELNLERGSTYLDLFVNENSVNCIVHLANPKIYTSNTALGQTLTMLKNVIDVCVANNIYLIYLSGWEIYSGYRGSIVVNENTPAYPFGPYGETKFLCETLINHSRSMSGLHCTLLRSSPVYCQGGEKPKFLYTFIEKALKGSKITTHRYLNGDPILDLLHRDDLVSAIVNAISIRYDGDLNLGTGIGSTTPDIAKTIIQELNSTSTVDSVDIQTEVACIRMDNNKAKQILRWKPTVPIKAGIMTIIEDYKKGII